MGQPRPGDAAWAPTLPPSPEPGPTKTAEGSIASDPTLASPVAGVVGRADAKPLPRGTKIGSRYEIVGELGAGGMGIVYAARDHLLEQEVAVKFVHPSFAEVPAMRRALQAEVRLTQQITHAHVARTFTLEESDGHLFIVMELLRGRTLAQRLHEGAIAVDEAVAIARDVLDGLAAAHRVGVVHRDIKPGNVTLCEGGRVVLMDFGLARVHEVGDGVAAAGGGHTTLAGTPGYIAPEVASGDRATASADLYAVGVVLFEMLAGAPPYKAGSVPELLAAHVDRPVPDVAAVRPETPAWLAAAVRRLMAKSPPDRYATAAAARAALESPSVQQAQAVAPRPRRWWPWAAAAAACAVTGAIALAIGVAGGGGGAKAKAEPEPARSTTPAEPPKPQPPPVEQEQPAVEATVQPPAVIEEPVPAKTKRKRKPFTSPSPSTTTTTTTSTTTEDTAAEKRRRQLELKE